MELDKSHHGPPVPCHPLPLIASSNHSTPQPQLDPANKAHKETAPSEFWSTSVVGKPEETANLLDSTKSDMVIWLGTETWLDTSICSTELFPSHCKLYMKDHNRGGGVLIAERGDIHGVEVAELGTGCDCEVLGVKLLTRFHPCLCLCHVYRPSVSDALSMQKLELSLHLAAGMRNAELLIAGNFHLLHWDSTNMTLKPNTSYPAHHQDVADLTYNTELE